MTCCCPYSTCYHAVVMASQHAHLLCGRCRCCRLLLLPDPLFDNGCNALGQHVELENIFCKLTSTCSSATHIEHVQGWYCIVWLVEPVLASQHSMAVAHSIAPLQHNPCLLCASYLSCKPSNEQRLVS